MPYSDKEKKLMYSLIKQYGSKKGKDVYFGMANSGKHKKIFSQRTKDKISSGHRP
jgi:hypothetical protein